MCHQSWSQSNKILECVTSFWPGSVLLMHAYDLGKEVQFLPGNHDVQLRQVALSVIGIKDFGSQDHSSFHRYYSLRPAYTQANKCTNVTECEHLGVICFLLKRNRTPYLYTDTSPTPNAPTIRSAERAGASRGLQRRPQMGLISKSPVIFIRHRLLTSHTRTQAHAHSDCHIELILWYRHAFPFTCDPFRT